MDQVREHLDKVDRKQWEQIGIDAGLDHWTCKRLYYDRSDKDPAPADRKVFGPGVLQYQRLLDYFAEVYAGKRKLPPVPSVEKV